MNIDGIHFSTNRGRYVAHLGAYELITPSTFEVVEGEPVPQSTDQFRSFLEDLRFESDITAPNGDILRWEGLTLFPNGVK